MYIVKLIPENLTAKSSPEKKSKLGENVSSKNGNKAVTSRAVHERL